MILSQNQIHRTSFNFKEGFDPIEIMSIASILVCSACLIYQIFNSTNFGSEDFQPHPSNREEKTLPSSISAVRGNINYINP